jgi:hypothetical protein
MSDFEFKYVRSVGLGLTYDVKILPSRYTISLEGQLLKDASRPTVKGGNFADEDAARLFAIDDIEKLLGMNEQ